MRNATLALLLAAGCSTQLGAVRCDTDDNCPLGSYCAGHECAPSPSCGPGLTACGAACRDLKIDPLSCGTCGQACTAPAGATAACASGSCSYACNPPLVRSGAECIAPAPGAVAITAPSLVTAGSAGLAGSVVATAGMTYEWTISGGVVTAGAGTHAIVFTAGSEGTLALGCTEVNAAGRRGPQAMATVTVAAAPQTPAVTAPASATTGATGLGASVSSRAGMSYAWTIAGGAITAGGATPAITFSAGAPGTLTLGCVESNAAGAASPAGTANVTVTAAAAPAPPTSVVATAGNRQAAISWVGSAGAASYNVYWASDPAVSKANGVKVAGASSGDAITGLVNDTKYYFVVTAVGAGGESAESATVSAVPVGAWVQLAPMPVGNERIGAAVAAANGALYVAEGTNGSVGGATEQYAPGSNSWATKAPGTLVRSYVSAGAINNKVYVTGGCVNSDCRVGVSGQLEEYDPVANSWRSRAPMPTPRFQPGVAVVGGALYVVAGNTACPPCVYTSVVEKYDPVANTWATSSSLPSARAGLAAAGLNGKLYALGGNVAGQPVTGELDVFDPAVGSWVTKASMPTPRAALGAVAFNGLIWAISGNTDSGTVNVVEAYDPATDTWSTKPSVITGRYAPTPAVLGNTIFLTGALSGNAVDRALEAYTP